MVLDSLLYHTQVFKSYIIPRIHTLKVVEFTKDCTILKLKDLYIEEIIVPNDPEYTYTIEISNALIKTIPPGLESVTCAANLPELETLDLTRCTSIYSNCFFNCTKLKHIIGWGDHEMEVGSSLFEQCPLIDIKEWTDKLILWNDFAYNHGVLTYTYIKEMTIKGVHGWDDYGLLFYCCHELQKVVFEENSNFRYINSCMFANCTKLSEVTLASSITGIGWKAFINTNLTTIDLKNVDTLSFDCFNGAKIKEPIFHKVLRELYYYPEDDFFQHLEKITLTGDYQEFPFNRINNPYLKEVLLIDNENFYVENNIVYSANKTSLILYPGGLEAASFEIPENVLEIGLYAFNTTSHLEKIIVHQNLILNSYMFYNCTSVKTIEFKNDKIVGFPNYCFIYCSNLTNIIIPDSVTIDYLGEYCFCGCTSLQTLAFKNELFIVGAGCFMDCASLKDVNLSRLAMIPYQCFKYSPANINLHLSESLQYIEDEAFMESKIQEFHCPTNLLNISDYAFFNCTELRTFEFNENIRAIGHLTLSYTSISELLIPNSLVSINVSSFVGSEIDFKFKDGGHPLYYVEGNCFMNKSRGLMFIIKNQRNYFEVPSTVKLIDDRTFQETLIYKVVVTPEKNDINLLENISDSYIICQNGKMYPYTNIYMDCRKIIWDYNNPARYAKEGEYGPTYKIDQNIIEGNEIFYYDDQYTHITDLDENFQKRSVPFETFDSF